MDDDSRAREQGVEFGDLGDELATADYPLTNDEVIDRYGDREIVMADETVTLGEVLEPFEETYQDDGDVRTAVLNMVGDEAIGRKGYSDRTPPAPGEDEDREHESI